MQRFMDLYINPIQLLIIDIRRARLEFDAAESEYTKMRLRVANGLEGSGSSLRNVATVHVHRSDRYAYTPKNANMYSTGSTGSQYNIQRLQTAEVNLGNARAKYEKLVSMVTERRKTLILAEDEVVGGAMYTLMENIASRSKDVADLSRSVVSNVDAQMISETHSGTEEGSTGASSMGEPHSNSKFIDWMKLCDDCQMLADLKLSDTVLLAKYNELHPRLRLLPITQLRYLVLDVPHESSCEVPLIYTDGISVQKNANFDDFGEDQAASPQERTRTCAKTKSTTKTLEKSAMSPDISSGTTSRTLGNSLEQLIVIRGTDFLKLKHLLLDLSYSVTHDPVLNVDVHTGFQTAALELLQHCLPLIDQGRPVRFVGHSLGAAVAIIASFYLRAKGFQVTGLTLFGCPRIVLDVSAKEIHQKLPPTIRVNNYMDIVRTLPPGRFKHVGRSVLLFEDGQYWDLVDPPDVEPAKFVSHAKAFAHHRTVFYLKTLQSKVAEQMGTAFDPNADSVFLELYSSYAFVHPVVTSESRDDLIGFEKDKPVWPTNV
eukprot:CFRG4168T1